MYCERLVPKQLRDMQAHPAGVSRAIKDRMQQEPLFAVAVFRTPASTRHSHHPHHPSHPGLSVNVPRTGSVQGSRGPGSRRRTGPRGLPEGGVRASEPGAGGGDQPLPQRDVLASLPAPAPGPGPSLRARGSHLHRQIHGRAVPECQGTRKGHARLFVS